MKQTDTPHSQEDQLAYYPQELFLRKNNDGEEYLNFYYSYYAKHLFALQEPSLYQGMEEDIETYRLTWLRTFHTPIAIRIMKQGDAFSIILKLCDGHGGYDPSNLVVNLHRIISYQDWENFQVHLNTFDFWSMETWDNVIGLDGADWILEGKSKDRYRLVTRHSPKKRIFPFFQACDYLIQLTGVVVPDGEKY